MATVIVTSLPACPRCHEAGPITAGAPDCPACGYRLRPRDLVVMDPRRRQAQPDPLDGREDIIPMFDTDPDGEDLDPGQVNIFEEV